ncbi:ABC transporter permease [Rhizobium lusitanum]|uniref:ABC transporter permease n=1 Tax=Rhizobium lusitanum TaxID=293958 RepID=UPI001FED80E4|nr:ABC transporter permease [Rhizobium lusitanum]
MAYRRQKSRSAMSLALEQKMNVMNAVMLRDMRTRFFNHGLGFLVQSFWPLTHIFVLIVIYNLAGRTAAYGDSVTLFFATALLPTMSFMYISRFMCLSLILNRQMLSFPAVKIVDIMFARAFLEIMAAFLTLFLTIVILLILGDDPFPADPIQAVLAYLSSLLLGVGIGSLAGVIVMFFELFATIYALFMVVVYVTSGIVFVAPLMPKVIGDVLSWSPVFGCVEWMRSAYYPSYPDQFVNKYYIVGIGVGSACLGLLLERVFRRQIMEG